MAYEKFVDMAVLNAAVDRLHHVQEVMTVFHTTGAGAGLQKLLWDPAGASRTILEAGLPYHQTSLMRHIGVDVDRTTNRETAMMMAAAGYDRAKTLIRDAKRKKVKLPFEPKDLIGLGVTAAVSTDRERRGDDKFFIATRSAAGLRFVEAIIPKGLFMRQEEGELIDLFALNVLLNAAEEATVPFAVSSGITAINCGQLHPWMTDRSYMVVNPKSWMGEVIESTFFAQPLFLPDGRRGTAADLSPDTHVLYPGSWNPLHEGHEVTAAACEAQTERDVVFVTTTTHPDKGDIPFNELVDRKRQFDFRHPVLFTQNDGLYIEKARRFPGFSFLMGADAVKGMLNPKYYGGEGGRNLILSEFRTLGTKFYVNGRVDKDTGRYETLDDLPIPDFAARLFIPVQTRLDMRSSDLRAQTK